MCVKLLPLTLREEHRLRVFENRVLRRVFGRKRDEEADGSRKLHSETLLNLYSSLNIIRMIKSRRIRWEEHVARMGRWEMRKKFWLERLRGMRPHERPGRKWDDNNKIVVREIGMKGVDWIHLALDRDRWRALVNTVMKLRVP
jgi:hypothetical protein